MLTIKAKYKNGKIILKNKPDFSGTKDIIITFLDSDSDDFQYLKLTKTGKELLKRKHELDSGKVKPVTHDEIFSGKKRKKINNIPSFSCGGKLTDFNRDDLYETRI